MTISNDYWPRSLSHLREEYDQGLSEHVVIAEVSEAPNDGYKGARLVRTALVPLEVVDEVLNAPGGIGFEVKSWGPLPIVREDEVYETRFWIDGRTTGERFETIVNSWRHHNREVLLPDNILLMTYGLIPRHLGDGTVCWDDVRKPVYDVLRVKSHVNYDDKKAVNPLGLISIRRDYLEDYCFLKRCAAVAVYYEERFSAEDETFDAVLKGAQGDQYKLPGRLLELKRLDGEYHSKLPQMCSEWGARLILKPSGRPISDDSDPELVWPDHDGVMTYQRASEKWIYGFVRDEVLLEYEAYREYRIYPESGGVSYGGWWATDRTNRVGRNHIRIELKKLYEGCPAHVVSHWHRFAVSEAVAEHDLKTNGDQNIANRAKKVLHAFLEVALALERLSSKMGGSLTQEDIGSLTSEKVEYHGWYSLDVMHSLYAVALPTASREEFLDRTVSLFKLIELFKPAALRTIARQLGVSKELIKDFQSLKLMACICQLATIANEQGHSLVEDSDAVVAQWDPKRELAEMQSLFSLNGLRQTQAHTPGVEREGKIAAGAAVFGIDGAAMTQGWGYAIDALYDRLFNDLTTIGKVISHST